MSGTARDADGLGRVDLLERLDGFPRAGGPAERWSWLTDQAREDLARVKLLESHVDAVGILAEIDPGTPVPDRLLAVWAAEPPGAEVTVRVDGEVACASGTKAFCSGAEVVDAALVTVRHDGAPHLALLDVAAARAAGTVTVRDDAWLAGGMHRAGTRTLELADVPCRVVGGPAAYLERAGFWHGAIGVAACWHGGTLAVADLLHEQAARRRDALVRRQLGVVGVDVAATGALLDRAARTVAAGGAEDHVEARVLAETVRAQAARAARAVLDVVRTSLGPGPVVHRPSAVRACEDLAVYVLQHHGDRDLESLGTLLEHEERPW